MKIGKEYILVIILGLFLLAYVLEKTVKPLTLNLVSPYQFLGANYQYWKTYPFTSTIIFIRSLALFIAPLWLWSFFGRADLAKGGLLLLLAGLMQLYAIQEVASGAHLVPLEWSLSLSLAGAALVLPAVVYLLAGLLHSAHEKISAAPNPFTPDEDDD